MNQRKNVGSHSEQKNYYYNAQENEGEVISSPSQSKHYKKGKLHNLNVKNIINDSKDSIRLFKTVSEEILYLF